MILYGVPNPAPNPRRVRIFLHEKGINLPETLVKMLKGDHKLPWFLAKNSLGQLPTLELDDGTIIAETVAICRYFEETKADPPLFGSTPVEKAQVDMWVRRIEFKLMEPVSNYWRHAHPRTASRISQFTEFGESNRETYKAAQRWMNAELEGKAFVMGETYSVADICLLTTVDFAEWAGLPLEDDVENLKAWRARVSARPSAEA